MIKSINEILAKKRMSSLQERTQSSYVDIHCHCVPAVDDGPATRQEALSLCRLLVEDGVSTVIATPHQLGRFAGSNEATRIRDAVAALNDDLKKNDIPLNVLPGGDVRLDERIVELLETDKILTLADGGKYILLELPQQVFIDIEPLLIELKSLGVQAVISHPERVPILIRHPDILSKWLKHPAYLQVTAGSILGDFGPEAQKAAWSFLERGWVSLLATDAHDLYKRKPCFRASFKELRMKMGEEVARSTCVENPARVVRGQNILASYPVRIGSPYDERQ